MLIFVHIPKTAGTTLRTILSTRCRPRRSFTFYERGRHRERLALLQNQLSSGRVPGLVTGHVGYGLHGELPASCRYVTMLREPVARVVSMYHHIRRHPNHHYFRDVSSMSLPEYVRSGVDESARDSQTRFLSGVKWDNELARGDWLFNYGDGGPEAMLERAMENVGRNILVTGVTERFDESLLLLREALGWGPMYYARLNRAGGGAGPRASPGELDIVAEHNQLDLRLYAYALGVLEEKLDRLPFDRVGELRSFRKRNALLGFLIGYPNRAVQRIRQYLDGAGGPW